MNGESLNDLVRGYGWHWPKFYFTWGYGQEFPNGYTVVQAPNADAARQAMHGVYGREWSMMYDSAETAGVEEYKLILVPFDSLLESRYAF